MTWVYFVCNLCTMGRGTLYWGRCRCSAFLHEVAWFGSWGESELERASTDVLRLGSDPSGKHRCHWTGNVAGLQVQQQRLVSTGAHSCLLWTILWRMLSGSHCKNICSLSVSWFVVSDFVAEWTLCIRFTSLWFWLESCLEELLSCFDLSRWLCGCDRSWCCLFNPFVNLPLFYRGWNFLGMRSWTSQSPSIILRLQHRRSGTQGSSLICGQQQSTMSTLRRSQCAISFITTFSTTPCHLKKI